MRKCRIGTAKFFTLLLLLYRTSANDAGFKQIADDKETNIILIPGDLVYRGEYQSHIGLRNRLYKLKEQGKKTYLITARHDYDDNDSFEFDGDKMLPVKAMPRD